MTLPHFRPQSRGVVTGPDWEVLKVLAERKEIRYTFITSKRWYNGIMQLVRQILKGIRCKIIRRGIHIPVSLVRNNRLE